MQIKGLLWKDGGPVIGVQIENEYGGKGPDGGPAYIFKLKRMAEAAGLDVPLYTVTGWDNAVWPPGEVLPVYGGYPDAPWDPRPGPDSRLVRSIYSALIAVYPEIWAS